MKKNLQNTKMGIDWKIWTFIVPAFTKKEDMGIAMKFR